MNNIVILKCGHRAFAINQRTGEPACPICGCEEVDRCTDDPFEGLQGRTAKCTECRTMTKSRWTLPFFRHRPDETVDEYYCGCHGWD